MTMNVSLIWDVTPYGWGIYTKLYSVTRQKTVILYRHNLDINNTYLKYFYI
jgi:hypothetical protein